VEFALLLPLVALAMGLIVQTAVIVRDQLSLWRVVGTATRLAAIHPDDEGIVRSYVDDHLHLRDVDVEIDHTPPLVTVTLAHPYEIHLWFVGLRIYTISASATMYAETVQ
jgi:hypothetical protein